MANRNKQSRCRVVISTEDRKERRRKSEKIMENKRKEKQRQKGESSRVMGWRWGGKETWTIMKLGIRMKNDPCRRTRSLAIQVLQMAAELSYTPS